jgi:mannose-6-phosphate isomerase-like protein (cupin superfamily)
MILRGRRNVEARENHRVHDGEGFAVARRLFTRADFSSGLFFYNESWLQPGSSYGEHRHEGDEEVYYVLEGTGLMRVDDEEQEVGPGDAILTKSGSRHSLRNTGQTALKLLVIGARVERAERAERAERVDGPGDEGPASPERTGGPVAAP